MAQANQMYLLLSPTEQERYRQRALQQQAAVRQQREADVEAAQSLLQLQGERSTAEKESEGLRNMLSEVTVKDRILPKMEELLEVQRLSLPSCRSLVKEAMSSPMSLTGSQQDTLLEFEESLGRPSLPARPPWLKEVCSKRDEFSGAIFRVIYSDKTEKYFLFLYAKQNPREMAMVELQCLPLPDNSSWEKPWSVDSWAAWGMESFELLRPLTFHLATTALFPPDSLVLVYENTFFSAGTRIVAYRSPKKLQVLLDSCDAVPAEKADADDPHRGSKRRRVCDLPDYILENHPWLREWAPHLHRKQSARSSVGSEGHASQQRAGHSDRPQAETKAPLSANEEEAAWETLRRLRQQWSDQVSLEQNHFPVSLRGGAWTKANRGTEADCVSAGATKGAVWQWCQTFHLPKMARFTLKYGTDVATALAQEWSKKMQFYYSLYLEADDPDFRYSELQTQAYVPDSAWSSLKPRLEDRKALARAESIDSLCPVNP